MYFLDINDIPSSVTVSSSIQSPVRLQYHPQRAPIVSATPTSTISAAPNLIQSASGAYIAAPLVSYAGVPPGVTGPAMVPIVPYPGPPQAPIPAPVPVQVQQPASDAMMRGGTTYFPPEAQRVQNVRGGTTYFNPEVQHMRDWQSPVRRPKLAIPIVSPEVRYLN